MRSNGSSLSGDGFGPSQEQTYQGILEYAFGDGHDQTHAFDRYHLYTGQERIELRFRVPPWRGFYGKQVVVEGRAMSAQGGAGQAVDVSDIGFAQSEQTSATYASVTGTKNIILLLVKFSGDAQEPHLQSWYTDLINPDTGNTVDSFYRANSWNKFSFSATATPWMLLPSTKATYANCGWETACLNWSLLFDDAVAAGLSYGVNFDLYDNIAIVTNNDLDCCAWGGSMVYNGKLYGVVWEPPWAAQQGTFAHELGHSVGLPHSGWVYYAYDSPWDVMSKSSIYNQIPCGSYYSVNSGGTYAISCPTPEDIIAPYKDMLGWIDPPYLLTVPAGSGAGLVQVDTLAAPLSGNRKMIKVCVAGYDCTSGGSTARYYTVEVRTHYTSDPGFDFYLQNEGVIIHFYWGNRPPQAPNQCYFNSQSGPAYPIDNFNVVPSPHYTGPPQCSEFISGQRRGLYFANWNDGQSYEDVSLNVEIQVVSHSTGGGVTTYVLNINQGTGFSLSNSGDIVLTHGDSGSTTITATLITAPADTVNLACSSGLPSGATCDFNPPSGTPTFQSTLTISTLDSTPSGIFTITVTGTSVAGEATTSFSLTVTLPSFFHPSTEFWFSRYDMVNAEWDAIHVVNLGASTATIQVTIGTVLNDAFTVPAGQATYKTYPGVEGGPVHILSDQLIWATQRVLGWTAMQEIYGMPGDVADTNIIWTWYDNTAGTSDEVLVINPNTTDTANVDLYVAGILQGQLSVGPGEVVGTSFPDMIGGPLIASSDIPVFASQRVIGFGDFAEIVGMPSWYTFTDTWFNWYDMASADWDGIHLLNPGSTTANVNIYIAGILRASVSLAPSAADYRYFPGVMAGPVRVLSDQPVWVTQRIIGWGGWKEVFGVAASLATQEWHFTWYDMADAEWDGIHFINPGGSSATVSVYIGGTLRGSVVVGAGKAAYVYYSNLWAGPIRIVSSRAIISSQRILGWGSFEETIGASLAIGASSPAPLRANSVLQRTTSAFVGTIGSTEAIIKKTATILSVIPAKRSQTMFLDVPVTNLSRATRDKF
jgi:hypothetical protein